MKVLFVVLRLDIAVAFLAAFFTFAQTGCAADRLASPGSYKIKDGKVDVGTYLGWRVFHSTCFTCHGVDALGTDLAPNLVERIKGMTPREFATKVMTSYRIILPATEAESPEANRDAIMEEVFRKERGKHGEIIMPAWETNLKVKPHILDLYAYLSARADGILPAGRPKMVDK
jgi:mono/diheme cytochrome c family protein